MITISYNEAVRAIEIEMDLAGIDLLIKKLEYLKQDGGHVHIFATNDDTGLCTKSPYEVPMVYTELILDLLPTEAWSDQLGD